MFCISFFFLSDQAFLMNWNLSQWSIFQITNNFCLTKYLIYVEDLYLHIVCLHVFGIKVCFCILYITEKGLLRCSPTIICRAHITKHFLSIQPHNKSYKRKQFDEKKFHHKKDRQVFKSSSTVWGKKKKDWSTIRWPLGAPMGYIVIPW